jgi:hypothetical protein
VCRNSSCLGDPHIQDQAPEVRQMGRITSETFRRSWEYCCQKKVWRTGATFLQETIRKWSTVRIFISFFFWNDQILIVSFSHRILREQWIRAKYEREEFIHVEKQRYARGTMEGFLFKRSKVDDSCKQRRFVLSERDNTLKYFVSNVRRHFLNMFFSCCFMTHLNPITWFLFSVIEKRSQGGNPHSRHERGVCSGEIETSYFPSINLHQSGMDHIHFFYSAFTL